ncbi:hypothetical protein EON80_19750 [bacterium]|nr:MAG: hypothetical protein EON80_19750 [bacterium]
MAVTYDFGKCSQCGDNNSKSIQACRSCSAPLPWAKQASVKDSGGSTSKIGMGDVAYGGIAVALIGGLVFVAGAGLWLGNVFGFFPTFPGAGYIGMLIGGAVWRFGSNME